MHGRNGLCAARNVEVEFHTERGHVSPQNVHMLILVTINVMEMITKRRNVMNNVAQVCLTIINSSYVQLLIAFIPNRKTILGCMEGMDCV